MQQLQLYLQQSLRREKLASMINEVVVVGADILNSTAATNELTKTTMTSGTIENSDLNSHFRYSLPEGVLSASEIYEQLMDMQFERLISENAALKVKLKMSELMTVDRNVNQQHQKNCSMFTD